MNKYTLYPTGFLRSPILNLNALDELLIKMEIGDFSFLTDKLMRDAFYVANPSFLKVLDHEDFKSNKKGIITLGKYLTRMCTNCTPFGLFAGSALANFTMESEQLEIGDLGEHKLLVRLNFSVFYRIYEIVEKLPDVRSRSLFVINPTIHHFEYNNTVRFLKFSFDHDKRDICFELMEIESNEYIAKIIREGNGLHFQDLVQLLIDENIEIESASEYIYSLIDVGFFYNDLLPSTTDIDYLNTFSNKLQAMEVKECPLIDHLKELNKTMLGFRVSKIGQLENLGKSVEEFIARKMGIMENVTLHVDLNFKLKNCKVDQSKFNDVKNAILVYLSMMEKVGNPIMKEFIEKFRRRYGESPIPLKNMLDRDTGINLFFDDATYSQQEDNVFQDIKLSRIQKFSVDYSLPYFSETLISSVIQRKAFDLSSVKVSSEVNSNIITGSVYFTDNYQEEGALLYVKNISSRGFSNLLGRFNYFDDSFFECYSKMEQGEDDFMRLPNTDIIDIMHFPSIKSSNLVIAKQNRKASYSIFSNSDGRTRLELDDLYLQIINGELHLKCYSTGRRIIPRLSNAHNFQKTDSCQLYSLLALIGIQSTGYKGLQIGAYLDLFKYFPRINYKNIVMVPQMWMLDNDIKAMKSDELILYFEKNNLPFVFYLVDNAKSEILITLKRKTSIKIFINIIQTCEKIIIQECLWGINGKEKKKFELFFSLYKEK